MNQHAVQTLDLTEAEARKVTDDIKANLDSLSDHIYLAMTGKAYKALGYSSVQTWAVAEFGLSRSRIYQLFSWKLAEQELISACDLSPTWTVLEGHLRDFTSGAVFRELVSEAIKAVEGIDDPTKRGIRVAGLLLKKKAALDASRATKKQNAVTAGSTDAPGLTPGPDAATKGTNEPVAIVPTNESLAYEWVKAQDSAAAITTLATPDQPEVKAALTIAVTAFHSLLAKLEAGEGK